MDFGLWESSGLVAFLAALGVLFVRLGVWVAEGLRNARVETFGSQVLSA